MNKIFYKNIMGIKKVKVSKKLRSIGGLYCNESITPNFKKQMLYCSLCNCYISTITKQACNEHLKTSKH